jgi:hypothetical protein
MPDGNRIAREDDEVFTDRVAAPLRAAEQVDSTFGERVMSAVRAEVLERATERRSTREPSRRGWWRRSWTFQLTPVTALAAAAVIVVLALLGIRAGASHRGAAPTTASAPHDTVYMVRFVLLAPHARSVAVVGDFNNWNRATTTLAPSDDGVWTASVALLPGRHEYAFIVDGEHWMADPQATVTIHDDFGTASSIVTVGTRQS